MKGAGGTSGGLGTFFAGFAMLIAGLYLLFTRVTVTTGGWHLYGYNAFGISLFPLLIGIGVLFFNGKSTLGWGLTLAGGLIIVVGLIANLGVYLQPTSLFDTLIMLGLITGGVGVLARSLKAMPDPADQSGPTRR